MALKFMEKSGSYLNFVKMNTNLDRQALDADTDPANC
jgi:hypothetical protein